MRNKKSLQTRRYIDPSMPALFRYRFLITLCVLLVAAGAFCGSVSAYADVQTAQNLSDALNSTTDSGVGAAYVDSVGNVVLNTNVNLNFTINITATNPSTITLTTESAGYNISRNISGVPLFNVSSGTFILKGNESYNSNITLDGNKSTYTSSSGGYSLVKVNGGIFTMSDGSVLQNSNASTNGGGVLVNTDGTFTMSGGTISNNAAIDGGGMYVHTSGTFNMTGGTITNNTASGTNNYGGGVYVNSGTFNMNGGTISDNTATSGGGGVYVCWGGIFNMNGGNISGNNAQDGGGVYVWWSGSIFNMDGGIISGNNATAEGGGVYVWWSGSIFNMSGGTISDNIAMDGGGVYVNSGTFNLNGSATVNTNNDVYLTSGKFITVTGDLDPSAGALNITPAFTGIGDKVVEYGNVDIQNWSYNFALNTTWIQENHKDLAESGTNLSLSDNFTVKYYLTDSNMTPYYTNTSVPYDATLTPPAAPTRTGYTFSSWNQGSSSGIPWNFADGVKANTYLYAKWTENPTPVPTDSGDGGNDGNNADYGPVSLNGTFTTEDGNLTLHYPAGSSVIVTVFKDYFNGAAAPSGVLYLNVYDVHSTANSGTSVTLVFRIAASDLERMNLTFNDNYYDGEWHQMTIKSIDLVDGVYQFTVTSTHTSPFMIAYNVDQSSFPIEDTATLTTTPTSTPTGIGPTSTTTPTPTEPTSSPVPLVGIIAGLGAAALLLRRRK